LIFLAHKNPQTTQIAALQIGPVITEDDWSAPRAPRFFRKLSDFSSLEFVLLFLPDHRRAVSRWRAEFAGAAAALGVMTTASLVFYAISSVSLMTHRMGGANTNISVANYLNALFHSLSHALLASVAVNYVIALMIQPGTHRAAFAMEPA